MKLIDLFEAPMNDTAYNNVIAPNTNNIVIGFEFEFLYNMPKDELIKNLNNHYNLIVFDRYHEKTKNSTSWYLEPDTSLGVNGLELVSPPMPYTEAIFHLKDFYGFANHFKLTTNEKTGLHVNISVSNQKLNKEKLIHLLGDKYLLNKFGRLSNEYSTPTQTIADTTRHKSSINVLDNYVSFRHIGGNYLNEYNSVISEINRMCYVMILSNSEVFNKSYLKKKYKSENIEQDIKNILGNPSFLSKYNYSEKVLKQVILDGPTDIIRYIKNPSEDVQLAAVHQKGRAILYIKNPSEAVKVIAVKNNGFAIEYINNPSKEIQLAAVQQNGYAIEYINNPSEVVQLAAVQQNGYAIRYINNPSEAVQLAAVQQIERAIKYINNPTQKVKDYVASQRSGST